MAKNPQNIPRMDAINTCMASIRDVRFRFDLTDEERDLILLNTSKDLGEIYDSMKQELEG